jgi:glutamine cyclotransferase
MAKTTTRARQAKQEAKRAGLPAARSIIIAAVVVVLAVAGAALLRSDSKEPGAAPEPTRPAGAAAQTAPARQAAYRVVNSYPHDPEAFLQGLVYHDGNFYESTGLQGRSSLRLVDFPSGKVEKMINLSPEFFGEGLAVVGDRLVQLTWTTRKGFVYDRESFRLLREFSYQTEGWGITYDGKHLVMSDGTNQLTFLDPETFEPVRRLRVTMDGRPLNQLNELEFIQGEIWANVWQQDIIVRIDPESGRVTSFLNLRGILRPEMRTGNEDVLNGIAYDEHEKRIFVSGKLWPRVFEIQVD